MDIFKSEQNKNLARSFLYLNDEKEAMDYLRDLMTEQEIETFASRLAVAKMLNDTETSYRKITDETGMSTTTITRINNWLNRGRGGYKTVLNRMHSHTIPESAEL